MINEILKENANSKTKLGLKYSVLSHYIDKQKSIKSIGLLVLSDGTRCSLVEEEKEKSDADIMQNIIYKYLRFDTPEYIPVDLGNDKRGMLRTDLSNDDKSLINTLTKGLLRVKPEDLIDKTVLASDFHKKMNECLYVPDLKDIKNIDDDSRIRNFFFEKKMKKLLKLDTGKRPLDAIFVKEHNRFIDFFSDKALRELVIARMVKLATFDANNDLSTSLYNLKYSEVQQVIPQSSGVRVDQIKDLKNGKEVKKYHSEFSTKPLSLQDTVEAVNKNVADLKDDELKQKLRFLKRDFKNMRLEEKVRNYEEQTGYKIDDKYVSLVKTQMKEMSDMIK